MLVRM